MKMKVTLVVVLSATLCMAQKLTQTKPAPPDTASASVPQDAKKGLPLLSEYVERQRRQVMLPTRCS